MGISGEVILVRGGDDVRKADALVIPGGESTTISKLLVRFGIRDAILERAARDDLPIMGTCAGMVLLSKDAGVQAKRTGTVLLELMDLAVDRNAFGRQRESFETELAVKGFDSPVHAVFIRAPAGTVARGDCEALATFDGKIVLARQGRRMAVAFHPELTDDTRIHEMFLKMV